jgi:hypothetical protein
MRMELSFILILLVVGTADKQEKDGTQFYPDPACQLLANLYDIYHCCVYSEKLLMMDRESVRDM